MEEELPLAKLKQNLQEQLYEIEMLQSMFPNPGELKFDDANCVQEMRSFVDGESTRVPPFIDLTLNIHADEHKFEVCVNLSQEYPDLEPDVYIRNDRLSKAQHARLNKDCHEYTKAQARGEPCVYSIITWIQDNAGGYIEANVNAEASESAEIVDERMLRLWIYSHHIYSKMKRREILGLAQSLNVNGFCMPGKPGIICVEGRASACNEWWQIIKSMTWKRIFCKVTEDCKTRRFETFEEVGFQSNGARSNHMDMGELYKYLEERQLGFIFKELFGVDGKSS